MEVAFRAHENSKSGKHPQSRFPIVGAERATNIYCLLLIAASRVPHSESRFAFTEDDALKLQSMLSHSYDGEV
jgi:hypothetical protein